MNHAPLTHASDPGRLMPGTPTQRLDAVRAAIASLRDEQRRLERVGLELPLARCHQQLRYWQFLDGLLSVAAGDLPIDPERTFAWPAAPRR